MTKLCEHDLIYDLARDDFPLNPVDGRSLVPFSGPPWPPHFPPDWHEGEPKFAALYRIPRGARFVIERIGAQPSEVGQATQRLPWWLAVSARRLEEMDRPWPAVTPFGVPLPVKPGTVEVPTPVGPWTARPGELGILLAWDGTGGAGLSTDGETYRTQHFGIVIRLIGSLFDG